MIYMTSQNSSLIQLERGASAKRDAPVARGASLFLDSHKSGFFYLYTEDAALKATPADILAP